MAEKICEYCGVTFHGRSDAKFCSTKHRVYARRAALAADEKTVAVKKFLRGSAMLKRLRSVAPKSAAAAAKLIEAQGTDCTEAAVILALTAYAEASEAAAPKSKAS